MIYTYYALSGFGPSVRPYLWWKKYLTSLQLVSCEPQGGLCKQKKLWGGSKFQSGREENFIHAVMYTYDALSGFGPSVRPYLWWKKCLTSLQLVSCEPQGGLCKQTSLWEVKISVRERRKCHPCCDVYILRIVRLWAVRASISLVEEISHQFTAGKL